MGPGHVTDEALEQQRGRDGSRLTGLADVLHVGNLRFDVALVDVGQRELPVALPHLRAGVDHASDELLGGAHDRGDLPAQGDGDRTGQGGHVDNRIGLELSGEREAIGEDEATLGVGVEHLDGLAVSGDEHVVGLGGTAARHVLGHRRDGRHLDGELQASYEAEGREHDRRAGHVGLHRDHAGGGLQREPTRVEGDALAHQHDVLGSTDRRPGRADEARVLLAAPGNAKQSTETLGLNAG